MGPTDGRRGGVGAAGRQEQARRTTAAGPPWSGEPSLAAESAYRNWPDQVGSSATDATRRTSTPTTTSPPPTPPAPTRAGKTKAKTNAAATRRDAKLRARGGAPRIGRPAAALASRLRHAVEGAPPTWGMRLSSVSDGVAETRARAVIDLAMRIAEALLTTGSSAADVTATVLQLTDAYGLRSVHIDVTYTSITVSHHRGAHEDPVTIMRVVSGRATDFDRLQRIQALVANLAADPVPIAEARARFTELMERPHPYRHAVVTAASAGLAGAIAALLDGTPVVIGITLLTAVAIDRALAWVASRKLAAFFAQIVGGAIPTAVAVALMYARAHDVPALASISPSVVVTAGIVVLLAGLQLVGAAQDAIDGYYVTATGRGFEVILLTLGVVVGILLVLGAGRRLGMPAYIPPSTTFVSVVPVQLALAALVSAAFAVTTYASPRAVLVSLGTGALGWASYVVASAGGLSVQPASAVGAFAVGLGAQALGRVFRVPALAIATAGLITLLPGGMVYRGLYEYMARGSDAGLQTLMSAGTVGLALAAGVSLGTYVGRPVGEARNSATQTAALRRALKRRARAAR